MGNNQVGFLNNSVQFEGKGETIARYQPDKDTIQVLKFPNRKKMEKESGHSVNIVPNDTKDNKHNKITVKEIPSECLSIDSNNYNSSLVPNALNSLGYELHQQIGYGGFSTVYMASNRRLPGVQFACKVFALDSLNKQWTNKFLRNEMRIMTKLRHRNIISAFDVFKMRSKAYIFMIYAKNGSMDAYISKHGGRANEDQCRKWMHGLMSGLRYLHFHSVAHRDLKLENFLLDESLEAMISDFGFAVYTEKAENDAVMCKTLCGTTLYLSPEVRMQDNVHGYDAKKSDIYSMGICFYEMLHGFRPFEGEYDITSKELITRQMNQDYRFSKSLHLSASCRNLINKMLDPKPQSRPCAKVVLNHQWFDK
ncbi:hypothetical protein RDWZM_001813 [Blomia tropicalis]|uniref:Protein kinase domain-containing protein n=1 Tax=Blomia tropicalis TaxID=40697 RepID=A0A9Q0RPB6_BLOTA|nr:hypothetical protein RDWZM_001813 [Blomia tropicalis]